MRLIYSAALSHPDDRWHYEILTQIHPNDWTSGGILSEWFMANVVLQTVIPSCLSNCALCVQTTLNLYSLASGFCTPLFRDFVRFVTKASCLLMNSVLNFQGANEARGKPLFPTMDQLKLILSSLYYLYLYRTVLLYRLTPTGAKQQSLTVPNCRNERKSRCHNTCKRSSRKVTQNGDKIKTRLTRLSPHHICGNSLIPTFVPSYWRKKQQLPGDIPLSLT